ncbi:hypothetical protein FRC11_002626 [Ceratobasidium sp. 423]|nr:hypothetical protein FRC11_002626 [Ceratobasidium sp. 423]
MNIEGAEDMGAVANPLYDMHAAIATPDGDIYSASQPSADSKKWSWKCFVASSQGERFQVHWWLGQPKAVPDKYKRLDLRATVYIDGAVMGGWKGNK